MPDESKDTRIEKAANEIAIAVTPKSWTWEQTDALRNNTIIPILRKHFAPLQPAEPQRWISVKDRLPKMRKSYGEPAPYVLATDAKGRMSVGYCDERSGGMHDWVFAKPIGIVTHWTPLPAPPIAAEQSEPAKDEK